LRYQLTTNAVRSIDTTEDPLFWPRVMRAHSRILVCLCSREMRLFRYYLQKLHKCFASSGRFAKSLCVFSALHVTSGRGRKVSVSFRKVSLGYNLAESGHTKFDQTSLTCIRINELHPNMAFRMSAVNHSARCHNSRLVSSPRLVRCQRNSLRCVAQAVAAPATGTYSGREISKPLIGDHFLHIDDYSKDVNTCHARPCTST